MTDATGTTDAFNILAKVSTANIGFGTVVVAGVETLNITVTDTDTTVGIQTGSATLKADQAKTVNVAGNGNATLTLDAVTDKVTLVDASTLTGGLTFNATGAAAGVEVRGGAATDVLTSDGENDVLKGNAGNDTFNADELTHVYGGTGSDTFNFAVHANLTKVSKIYDLGSGDVINLKDVLNANTIVDTFYLEGAQFNSNTTPDVPGKVNAALVQTAGGEATWFNHGGNTYIVIDHESAGGPAAGVIDTYTAGQDIVIEIIGTFNLATQASFNATSGTLEIV
jgi:S-layer protein